MKNSRLRTTCYWLAVAATTIASAELTARFQDYARDGVPFLHTPNHDRDLMIVGPNGEKRGRVHGIYRHWKLNQFGFRGAEIAEQPSPNTARLLVLGSSEAFGLYESPGNEFPA